MSSSPPPKGGNHHAQSLALSWLAEMGWTPLAGPAFPRTVDAAHPIAGAEAMRLKSQRNDALYLIASRELSRYFDIQVATRWGTADAQEFGPLKIIWTVDPGKAQTMELPTLSRTALHAQVAATRDGMRNVRVAALAEAEAPHAFVAAAMSIRDESGPWTAEVLDTAMLLGGLLVQDMKSLMDIPRPDDPVWGADRVVNPVLPAPRFRSYPGGHALQLALLAGLLRRIAGDSLNDGRSEQLTRMVDQMIDHRRLIGVHTQVDNDDGKALGAWIADRLVAAAGDQGRFPRWSALFELACAEWET